MKKVSFVAVIVILSIAGISAAVPGVFNYQGRLTDSSKKPITTATNVTFTFWDSMSGGNQLGGGFSDSKTVTPDSEGIFNTTIGDDGNPIPEAIFAGDSVWLNINVAGEDLVPRQRIATVGYSVKALKADTATTAIIAISADTAVNAGNADTVDNKHAEDFAEAVHSHNLQDLSGAVTDAQVPNDITIDHAATASGLTGDLTVPGNQIALGNDIWLKLGANNRLFILAKGQIFALPFLKWMHPKGLWDNISPDGQNASSPQVAMDDKGNAIIVWQQNDGSSKSQIFKSEYRGGVWTHPGGLSDNISPDGQNATSPQVAMDGKGNAIIVWHQNDGKKSQIFKSEHRGGVWTHPGGLSDNISPDGQNAYNPQVAMDDRGNAIIVWQQGDGSKNQIFKSEYRGGVWTHPGGLSDNISPDGQDASSPQVAMDNDGNAIIVWRQLDGANYQIFMSVYRCGVWTHPGGISDNISPDGQEADNPQVAMDNNGNAIIVWKQYEGSSSNQIFMSEYRNGVWIHPQNISDYISIVHQNAHDPQVAMDDNGNAIIVWMQWDGANDQIFMSEYRRGAWKHPASRSDNISPDKQSAYLPQVAMDNNENAVIVWQQIDGSKRQIFKSECWGGVWKHPDGLSDNISPDGQEGLAPQVAMDDNGNAVIVWQQFDGLKNQIFKSECGGFGF